MLRKAENCNCSCLTRILRKVWTDADSFRCRLQFALGVQSSQFFLGNGFREIGMPNYLIALKSHAQFQRKNEFVSRPCVRHPTRSFRATPSYFCKFCFRQFEFAVAVRRCSSPLQFAVAVRSAQFAVAVLSCSQHSQCFSASQQLPLSSSAFGPFPLTPAPPAPQPAASPARTASAQNSQAPCR